MECSLKSFSNYLHYIYKCFLFVPRRNEVAEGGYWITLRPSVRPSVRSP